MQSSQVVLRQQPLRDLTLHFKTREKCQRKSLAIHSADFLHHHQRARERRNRWMGEQAVDMRRISAHLAIVPIMGMTGGAKHARRNWRGNFDLAAPEQ